MNGITTTGWDLYEDVLRRYPTMDVDGAMHLLNGRIESGTTTLLTNRACLKAYMHDCDMECERLYAFAFAHVTASMASEHQWNSFLESFTSTVAGVVTRERATAGLLLVLLTENNQRWANRGPLADLRRASCVTDACMVVFDRGPKQFVTE